jgi:hypothetical protein
MATSFEIQQSGRILYELDARDLEVQGLLHPGPSSGVKRIHKRRLNTSSEEEYSDISLQIEPTAPGAADAFATIPEILFSLETLRYIGFSNNAAQAIWTKWANWPQTGPRRETDPSDGGQYITFIDFATSRLQNYEDVHTDDDIQWCSCLAECGMSSFVQEAIMDPAFKELRLSNSCIYWVDDTIRMRFAGLEDIRWASRQREMKLARDSSRLSGSDHRRGQHSGSMQQSYPFGGKGGEGSSQKQRSVSSMQQETTHGISSQAWNDKTRLEISNQPGRIVLFKGIDQGRITGLFDDSGALSKIQKLLSLPPSDFSGSRPLFYFTQDYRVAEYYAAYAKRRSEFESVVMVCLSIPQQAIDNLAEPFIQHLYWPSSHFKELVWLSKPQNSLPPHLRQYRDALLIISNVTRGANRMYEQMERWEDMTNECLLRIGLPNENTPAKQYVFSGEEEGREFLIQHGKLDVVPLKGDQLQALVSRYM